VDPGEIIANRFEIVSQAGSGGMGKVYRAKDLEAEGAVVALKTLHHNVSRDAVRFAREASLLQGFSHPHIVRYVSHGRTMSGKHYLVMEWIDGQTLVQRLQEEGLTMRETVTMAHKLAQAIAYAHAQGVIHRDIKPANVLFPMRDITKPKLIDFGIALRTQDTLRFTESGTVLGTPSYMAPEQARASRDIDSRSDVFSFGCLLYECLTAQVAFAGSNPLAVRAKALLTEPVRPSDIIFEIPPPLEALIMKMMSKNRDDRPRDGFAVVEALEEVGDIPETNRLRKVVDDIATQRVRRNRDILTGTTEQTKPLLCVLFATVPDEYSRPGPAPTAVGEDALKGLEHVVTPFGARLEKLSGQSCLVLIEAKDRSDALEQAKYAAQCALAVRKAFPRLALVLRSP
jgi:serine/threonine protein kinase